MERLKLNIQKFGVTSGSCVTSIIDNGTYFYCNWQQVSQDPATNKTKINYQYGVHCRYNYYINAIRIDYININGTRVKNSETYSNLNSGDHELGSGTMEIPHNTDGTKTFNINLSGWAWEAGTATGSQDFTLNNIPRYATCTQSLNSKTETSIKMNWSSDSTIDYVWYSTNNGSTWTAVGSVNAKSGNYTISGLTANTTYNIKTRVRRKDSQLTTDSTATGIATYNYPNCTSAPNFTIGNSVTLQFYNPLNRTFAIRMYSQASSSFVSDSINISGTSYTFTPNANTLYASIPNAKSSVYNIDSTYNTHKIVKTGGSYSVNETTNKPTFSDFDYEDTNATTLALTGDSSIVVQNYSNVRANISVANKAIAKNSATMSKYNLVIGNATPVSVNYSDSESVSTPSINNVSSNIINLYAEDSRGLTTLVSKTAVLKEYTDIQKENISVERAGNVGTNVTLKFNGTFWNDNFGDINNSITNVSYRFKKTSDSQWTTGATAITPTINGNKYSFNGGIAGDLGNSGFSAEYSFNVEVTVSDELSSTTFTFVLGTGIPLLAWGDNGVAIKQPYDTTDDSVLQVNGKTKIKGVLNATNNINSNGFLLEKNSQVTPIDITNTTETLLSRVKALGTNGIYRATWFSKTDGGTSGISDKPTGSANGAFTCTATCNRWASNSDYGYMVECYVQNDKIKYIAKVLPNTSSISWERQYAQKLEATRSRPTTANISHTYENDRAHLEMFLATSGMTTGKPTSDGYIIHCSWDNSGQYNGQLYLPNNNGNIPMQFRGCNNGTWGSWENIYRAKSLYDNSSGVTGNVTLSESSANFSILQIFYYLKSSGNSNYGSTFVYNPNGKRVGLVMTHSTSGALLVGSCIKTISGTNITNVINGTHNSWGGPAAYNEIFVYKVYGYR